MENDRLALAVKLIGVLLIIGGIIGYMANSGGDPLSNFFYQGNRTASVWAAGLGVVALILGFGISPKKKPRGLGRRRDGW